MGIFDFVLTFGSLLHISNDPSRFSYVNVFQGEIVKNRPLAPLAGLLFDAINRKTVFTHYALTFRCSLLEWGGRGEMKKIHRPQAQLNDRLEVELLRVVVRVSRLHRLHLDCID